MNRKTEAAATSGEMFANPLPAALEMPIQTARTGSPIRTAAPAQISMPSELRRERRFKSRTADEIAKDVIKANSEPAFTTSMLHRNFQAAAIGKETAK
jgi:hypothetical protein